MATKSLLFRAGVLLLSLSLLLSVFGCAMSEEDIADDNAAQSGYGAEESEETTKFDPTHTLPTDISYNGEKFTFLIRNESESISDMAVEHLADESSTMDKAVYALRGMVQKNGAKLDTFNTLPFQTRQQTVHVAKQPLTAGKPIVR